MSDSSSEDDEIIQYNHGIDEERADLKKRFYENLARQQDEFVAEVAQREEELEREQALRAGQSPAFTRVTLTFQYKGPHDGPLFDEPIVGEPSTPTKLEISSDPIEEFTPTPVSKRPKLNEAPVDTAVESGDGE